MKVYIAVEGQSRRGSLRRYAIIVAELEGWEPRRKISRVKVCMSMKEAEKASDAQMIAGCGHG